MTASEPERSRATEGGKPASWSGGDPSGAAGGGAEEGDPPSEASPPLLKGVERRDPSGHGPDGGPGNERTGEGRGGENPAGSEGRRRESPLAQEPPKRA